MFRKKRLLLITVGMIVALAAGGLSLSAALGQGTGQVTSNVTVVVRAQPGGDPDKATFSITIFNNGSNDVKNLKIVGQVPESSRLLDSYAGQPGANPAAINAGAVVWFHGEVAAGKGEGPFVFTVSRDPAAIVRTIGAVSWTEPDMGISVSPVAEAFATKAAVPRRGCGPGSCHDPKTPYNLAAEARDRAAARGLTHPDLPADTPVQTCLTCHAPGKGDRTGLGAVAKLALRDIVHPAHLFSPIFLEHYGGNCWTCHNADGTGRFVLLPWGLLDANEKGVPNNPPLQVIPPSEGTS
ncbi:MAG: hypothetical protein M1358_02535 [Chloroflexi bacterium]|nr:hypothetical protein [Chloroflexota bacterium]